jgi:hypothetical protein
MKGIEFNLILGLIILVAFLLIVVLVVFGPTFAWGSATQTRVNFEDFCIFWGLNGYVEGLGTDVIRNSINYSTPETYCSTILRKNVGSMTDTDIESCRKCCRKEIAC